MNCDFLETKFKLQSYYYVHFQTNTHGKVIEHSNLPTNYVLTFK